MEIKHSPGPWRLRARPADPGIISEHAENENWSVEADGGRFIAGIKLQPEDEANARLIAAAPAMLEALDGIVWKLERKTSASVAGDDCQWATIDRNDASVGVCRAAIRRAKGEDS